MEQHSNISVSCHDNIKKIVKYIVAGLVVGIMVYIVGKNKLQVTDMIIISLTAIFVYALLDTYAPTISVTIN